MLLPLAAVAGFAIDGTRQVSLKQHLQHAVDAAVLAGARSFKTDFSTTLAESIARESFLANLSQAPNDATCAIDQVTADRTTLSVEIGASCSIPMTFGPGIMGSSEIGVSADAIAGARHKIADVAMVVDLSGSMSNAELADLKAAAKRAAEVIIGDQRAQGGRVALAPFASGVNAGDFGNLVTGRSSGDDPEGDNETRPHSVIERVCVTERTGPDTYTDAEPVAGNYVGSVITAADAITRGAAGSFVQPSETSCPDSPILPLVGDVATAKAAIDGLQRSSINNRSGTNTAGHMGIVWAWYLLSPNWTSVWTNTSFGGAADHAPHPYGDPNRPKVVILMTDGFFQFGFEEQFTGDNWAHETARPNNAARQYCENMRAAGITIYAIGYGTNTDAERVLRDCADDPSRFLTTNVSSELTGLYEQIARDFLGIGLIE